ncbi:MAG: methyltransferase domain-containing protein [Chloroflexota bacterium]
MSEFDALAPTYDSDFTAQPIGEILRARVHDRLLRHFSANDHLLEMGCGTGEDALFLSQQGIHVTATDASDEMLAVARKKTAQSDTVHVQHLNLANLPLRHISSFDGAFSNFGALNCLTDWRPLAEWLSVRIETGGIVGLGIMSPYCVWEFGWHALHWKWDIALRRLRGDTFGDLQITYPTVKRISDDFAPYFERVHLMPLGLFLPTSTLFDVVQKRGWLMRPLISLENRFQDASALAMLADHYWIEFRRI